jgi:hypothetical protein
MSLRSQFPEFAMMRSHRRLIGFVAILGLAASAASAEAATLKRHHPVHRHAPQVAAREREPSFPTYIDQGSDRNPGGDNLYFTDTKDPFRLNEKNSYIIGPAYFQRWWD